MDILSIPTPFLVFDERLMHQELEKLRKAIDDFWPNTIIAYSVKTNSLPYLAKFFSSNSVCAEVVSEDEYDMVKECGYGSHNIICNGPVKSYSFVSKLMEEGTIINVDSHREIEYAIRYAQNNPSKQYKVGVRVNVDIESSFPSESKAGLHGSRFGFCMLNGEFKKAIEALRNNNIIINGLHLHVSTSTRRVEIYEWLTHMFINFVENYQLHDVEYFDIGGGFYGGIPDKPQWEDYLKSISRILHESSFEDKSLSIIIEPGVSLLAGAFSYYSSVIDVKDTNRTRFVVTDGSRIHIDPFFHKTQYFYDIISNNKSGNKIKEQVVVGFTCLEYDDIMILNNCDELKEGDIIRYDKLGAYTISLSPLFISYFPAVYAINPRGDVQIVRERWSSKEFIQKSIIS